MKSTSPDYSIIIPAYNEESFLGRTLESVRNAMNGTDFRGELIIVDNASTDRTAEIAREWGATVLDEQYRQISRARNVGAKAATGRFLFFLDADTLMSPEILHEALAMLASGDYYGGGPIVQFDSENLPWSVRAFTKIWNNYARNRCWAAGCFMFMLKEAFDAVGGFREDIYAGEEVYLSNALRKWGKARQKKFDLLNPPILTSARKIKKGHLSLLATMIVLGLCPFLARFRSLCWPWYGKQG